MKKILIIFFILLSFSTQGFAQANNSERMLTITDPYRNISVTFPFKKWYFTVKKFWTYLSDYDTKHSTKVKIIETVTKSTDLNYVYDKEISYKKKTYPGMIFYKEKEPLTLGGSVKAIAATYKNPSTLEVTRHIFYVYNNVSYEMKIEFKEKDFAPNKAALKQIVDGIRFPNPQPTSYTVTDSMLKSKMTAPDASWETFKKGDHYICFKKSENYKQKARICMFHSKYTSSSAVAASKEGIADLKKSYPNLTFLKTGQSMKIGSLDASYFIHKNPSDNSIVKSISYISNGRSVMVQFFVGETDFPKYKAAFKKTQDSITVF